MEILTFESEWRTRFGEFLALHHRTSRNTSKARIACHADSNLQAKRSEARRRGITRILTSTCHPAMVREMKRVGFTVAARGAVHLVKIVPGEEEVPSDQ